MFSEHGAETVKGWSFPAAARGSASVRNPMIPIFELHDRASRRCVERARDNGVTDVLTCPISPRTITDKLRAALMTPRPFIASADFFGPERRAPSAARRLRRPGAPDAQTEKGEGQSQRRAAFRLTHRHHGFLDFNGDYTGLDWNRNAGASLALVLAGQFYGVTMDELRKPTRGRPYVARARQIAIHLARSVFGLSHQQLAAEFHRDRSTVHHAYRLIARMREKNQEFDTSLKAMECVLRQSAGWQS